MFFYPSGVDEYEQRKQTGIWEGVFEYMKDFVTEKDNYDEHPVELINTNLFTIALKQVEPWFFIGMVISYENLFTDRVTILFWILIILPTDLH